jgi:hypothetical protein
MTNSQYSDLVQAAGNIRAAIMQKEMGDDGWDLRDEMLALQELVSQLATVVYQSHYIAYENVQTADAIQAAIDGYGHCPHCGASVKDRERRPDGNDTCANGHIYPSKSSVNRG